MPQFNSSSTGPASLRFVQVVEVGGGEAAALVGSRAPAFLSTELVRDLACSACGREFRKGFPHERCPECRNRRTEAHRPPRRHVSGSERTTRGCSLVTAAGCSENRWVECKSLLHRSFYTVAWVGFTSGEAVDYYKICDTLFSAMTHSDLKAGRLAKGLTQMNAAKRLGVSQSYVAMLESGTRRLPSQLARRAARVYGLPPTTLPPSAKVLPTHREKSEGLARDLAALGYPGFAYLRQRNWRPKNPSEVMLTALSHDDLEPRLVEALPWLLLKYSSVDRDWLVREAKLRDLQNRLGFVVDLARRVAERAGDQRKAQMLNELETEAERSRLAREDTLCRASLPEAERRWLVENRPPEAKHWNLLTDWTPDALRYVA